MSLGLMGNKVGMTRVFMDDGESVPVTVVDVSKNRIAQIKTFETDGYSAIQVAYGEKKKKRIPKPLSGHLQSVGVDNASGLKEFRVDLGDIDGFEPGKELKADLFEVGQLVDVSALSKGKGFSGVIRRHNFSSNRASHGNSISHNKPGSTGMNQDPGRVFPGKKMAGQYGGVRRTVQNLRIVRVDVDKQLVLLRGSVPGADGTRLMLRPAVKGGKV